MNAVPGTATPVDKPGTTSGRFLRIVMPGGNGHIGQILSSYFHSSGHSVTVLSRGASWALWRVVPWDGEHSL